MKIQCDVCNKDGAAVYCTADEAALCDTCDHRVHHANKLASKHQRFSLIHPSSKQFPICDICQEKRAFLFCQQDRAILCRDCDLSIHSANEHTQKHNRFLLTGVKLSATSSIYTSDSADTNVVADLKTQPLVNNSVSTASPAISHPPTMAKNSTSAAANNSNRSGGGLVANDGGGCGSMSSISEYLVETLPGWHVEDFLDCSSGPFGFSKADNGAMPFLDTDFESSLSSFSSENRGIWVPQAQTPPQQYYPHMGGGYGGYKESKEGTHMKTNSRSMWMDDGFTVPQISPPSVVSKRCRPF